MSDSDNNTPSTPKVFRRIGINIFLLGLLVPVVILFSLFYFDLASNMNAIEDKTQQTIDITLPGIEDKQRKVLNLENLRRVVEQIYVAQDPVIRQLAAFHAVALLFENYYESFDDGPRTQLLIRQLSEAKTRADAAWEQVKHGEILISGRMELFYALTDQIDPSSTVDADQLNLESSSKERLLVRLQAMETSLEPILAVCGEPVQADPDIAPLCTKIAADWAQIKENLLIGSDHERLAYVARHELDAILNSAGEALASAEVESSYYDLHSIGTEIDDVRLLVRLFIIVVIGIVSILVFAVHRHILLPIVTASNGIKRMRFGKNPESLRPARIKELQSMLDLLPDLSNHMRELNALSSKLEEEKDKYVNLSYVDAMTGVNNRRSFDNHIKHENRMNAVSILMLDVDMFKLYNDTLGHQAGDQALIAVAKAIEGGLLRSTDQVFRYGGEEFAAILPNASEDAAVSVASRIILNVHELNITHPTSSVAPILTVSIGVATRSTGENIEYVSLVERADKALYKAKSTGRNQVCVYRSGDSSPSSKE